MASCSPGIRDIKSFFLDASAIVKLLIDEKHSDLVRNYFDDPYSLLFTTNFCFFESLSVLKREWCKDKISTNRYRDCCRLLFAYIEEHRIQIKEYPLEDLHDFGKLDELVDKYKIDISDALQLLSIKETSLSTLAGESEITLITADKDLATAAREEGVKVVDLSK
ncbi:MAG TPA: type II toxin-antitoxin system VapC family toxin [Sedimentisphaerales bacterium]|nr:type II toxin-antitoxin system VapC family toxin [Sedimentisphaerales bacterium]